MSEHDTSNQAVGCHSVACTLDAKPAGAASSTFSMLRALGLTATICGVIVVGAYQSTLKAALENKRIETERAVFKVIPGATSYKEFVATTGGIAPAGETVPEGAVTFYAAYDKAGALKGIAAEAVATGYADDVRVLYAYDPQRQVITGFGVVSMRETPGIGDKILTDKDFQKNFEALDVQLTPDMKQIANAVKVVKHGSKRHPWEIDAIAGSTVTSKAVGKGIRDSTEKLLPLLKPRIDSLIAGAK
jgi:H+/Na+-translocating ferredoxin:NAD+ oxidoreductase subunit G